MKLARWLEVSFLCASFPFRAAAQATLGAAALGGTVLDEQDGVVVGAKIVLTETSKNLDWKTESETNGAFVFPAIGAGVYRMNVTKAGFAPFSAERIFVALGQRADLLVRLHVGEVRTVITVNDQESAILTTESNVIGSVIDSDQVSKLPLNGRNFLQLALLAGGAADLSPANTVLNTNIGRSGRAVVLPGTTPHTVGYSINGINVRGARDGELAVNLSLSAIDQFKVQESFFLPDQGANGAVVNIATKSGANEIHGEIFEFHRNQLLDARSFFAEHPEDLHRNQFGFAVGGPLYKDKLWFYTFYEGLREETEFSQGGYSPTAAMFGGNFLATGRTIYDPASYDSRSGTRSPFPGDAVPLSRINPVAQRLSAYYLPGTSLSTLPNNVYGNPHNTLDDDQAGVRFDGSWSPRHHLFAQIVRQNSPAVQGGLYPLSGLLYSNESVLTMAEYTWSASPRAVNTLRAGFFKAIALGGNEAQGKGPLLKSIGISNTFDEGGIGAVDLLGYSSFGRANADTGNSDNTWQIAEAFHVTHGSHSLSLGEDLRYRRGWHLNANARALGELRFEPAFTAQLLRDSHQPAIRRGPGIFQSGVESDSGVRAREQCLPAPSGGFSEQQLLRESSRGNLRRLPRSGAPNTLRFAVECFLTEGARSQRLLGNDLSWIERAQAAWPHRSIAVPTGNGSVLQCSHETVASL
jgi:hypothetical protein